jgi:hypothetical protein
VSFSTRRANQSIRVIRSHVKPRLKKYISFVFQKSMVLFARPASMRGANASSRTWGGMRWTRVVSQDGRCGARTSEIAWSWPPDAEVNPRVKSSGGTGANKPGTPRRARISRKPLRRECRCLGVPAAFFFCMRAAGATGASGAPAPSRFRGRAMMHHPGRSCRGNACVRLTGCHCKWRARHDSNV